MAKEWTRFLTALEAKGIAFGQIQFASDRQTVIQATGFTDPLSVAIIETEWLKQIRGGASGSLAPAAGGSPDRPLQGAVATGGGGGSGSGGVPALDDYSLLPTIPEEIQDVIVASEVLAAALGFGGGLIQFHAPQQQQQQQSGTGAVGGGGFMVSSYVPLSMRSLCQTILPVTDAYVAIKRVEEAEYLGGSLVGMALGEIVSEVATSYAHQVTKLQRWCEERTMPLMGVVSELLRVGHHIVRLRQVLPMDLLLLLPDGGGGGGGTGGTGSSGGLRGPRILNHLVDQAERCAGSREDSELVQLLLRRALVPYLRVLHLWMHEGVLEDPFGEFFITEAHEPARPAPTAFANSHRRNASHLFPEASLMPGTDFSSPFGGGGGGNGGGHTTTTGGGDLRSLPSGLTREQQQAQQQQDVLSFERRFSMNRLMIPSFLERPSRIAKMVFFAGKYRCLLREYNGIRPAFGAAAGAMLLWTGVDALHRRVQESFDVTSQAVIQLLFSSSVDLMGHLQSLKHYFLHERGDWVADFLDSADELLLVQSPVTVRAHPVRVLLQAAIARSCGAADPYHGLVGCSFSDVGLGRELLARAAAAAGAGAGGGGGASQGANSPHHGGATQVDSHRCLELLQLEVDLQWPLTLVLDAAVMARFNSIFRLLTWVKACERALGSLWYRNEVLGSFSAAYSLKHQLTHILRQFLFYAGHFVLEPLWSKLTGKIGQADSVFAISTALREFFEQVEMGLVLSSPPRFRSLSAVLTLSSRFCQVGMLSSSATMPLIEATLSSMQEELLVALSELASPVGDDYPQLVPLLTWIDFSGFYGRSNVYHVQRGGAVQHGGRVW